MTEKKYTNQDIWNMGAENTAKLLNKLTKENQKLKDNTNRQLLDLIYYTPTFITPTPIGLPYDNIYHRTSKQLENHLKDNGFLVDTVSRSSVGDLSFYHVEFNLSDDEWEYEKTNDLKIRELLGIRKVGLVDFHKQDGMIHEVILVSVKELDDKYVTRDEYEALKSKYIAIMERLDSISHSNAEIEQPSKPKPRGKGANTDE